MIDYLLQFFVTFLVVVEPIGVIPIFIAVTEGVTESERRRMARKGVMIAGGIFLLFAFGGGVFLRLLLSVALGVGIYFWPYDARCGFALLGYLAAVGVVTASGVWSAVWTWRHRSARGHTLSLLLILWGVILGAMEVLPRVGYAKTEALQSAAWTYK